MSDIPPPSWMLWPDLEKGPWKIELHWNRIGGRIECSGLEITSVPTIYETGVVPEGWEPEPLVLTSSILRKLKLGTMVEDRKRDLANFLWAMSETDFESVGLMHLAEDVDSKRESWRKLVAELDASIKKGGRPSLPASHYAEVAAIYSTAWQRGAWPTKAVQEHFNVSKSAAAKYVARARNLGLLGETSRGKAGGIDTEESETK